MFEKIAAAVAANDTDGTKALLETLDTELEALGNTPFCVATAADVPMLAALSKPGAVDRPQVYGATPMSLAARGNDLPLVCALLDAGAAIGPGLWLAARARARAGGGSDDSAVVARLLAAGAEINQMDLNQMTALHHAAHAGDLGVMEQLVRAGAQVNLAGEDAAGYPGETPIQVAAGEGNADAVRLLVQLGAKVAGAEDGNGRTIAEMARYHGFDEAAAAVDEAAVAETDAAGVP